MSNFATASASPILVKVHDIKRYVRRVHDPVGTDPVFGDFIFSLDITATMQDAYIPISIASSKKPTGFVYQIEGTAKASVMTTDISCQGDGITQITLGTIAYCKIPVGTTATFRIHVEMRGKIGESYGIILHQMNWKRDPSDARYQKLSQDIHTGMLKLR